MVDRRRRERIVEGAAQVIAEHGVERLTHRRVAEAAGVPLAATTYYFASLEELLTATMVATVERDLETIGAWFARLPADVDLPAALAAYLAESLGPGRRGAVVISELYAAARRRPELRQVVVEWEERWVALLSGRLGEIGARTISATIGGIVDRELLRDGPPATDELERTMRWLIGRER